MPEKEAIQFAVTETKIRDKKVGRVGTVTLESANSKGCSRIVLVGQETIINDYRVGEFYELTLNQVTAPAAD
jgi:hypothetical protein